MIPPTYLKAMKYVQSLPEETLSLIREDAEAASSALVKTVNSTSAKSDPLLMRQSTGLWEYTTSIAQCLKVLTDVDTEATGDDSENLSAKFANELTHCDESRQKASKTEWKVTVRADQRRRDVRTSTPRGWVGETGGLTQDERLEEITTTNRQMGEVADTLNTVLSTVLSMIGAAEEEARENVRLGIPTNLSQPGTGTNTGASLLGGGSR